MNDMKEFINELKKEYNNEPVYFCKECLSLKIKFVNSLSNSEYCEECNSTNIGKASIEEWDAMYVEKYGHHYLDTFEDNYDLNTNYYYY